MLSEELLRKVRLIEITTRKIVDDVVSGNYRSHFKGHGVQFSEHRLYVPGDDVRHIDWRVSARTRDLLVKKFEEERQLSVFIVVDVSGSQNFGTSGQLKSEMVAELGALLAHAATRTGDRVGVLLFASKIEKIIPPKKGRQHILRIVQELLTFKAETSTTDLAGALEATGRIMKHSGVIFVLSDFRASGYEIALKKIAKKHDVVAVRVSDDREASMPSMGRVLFHDIETHEDVMVDTGSYAFKTWFGENQKKFEVDLNRILGSSRAETLHVSTRQDYAAAAVQFFRARAKRKKG